MRVFFLMIPFIGLFISCNSQKQLHTSISLKDFDLDGIHDDRDACAKESGSLFNLGCPEDVSLSLVYNEKLSTDSDLDGVLDEKDDCPKKYGSPFNQGCPF